MRAYKWSNKGNKIQTNANKHTAHDALKYYIHPIISQALNQ